MASNTVWPATLYGSKAWCQKDNMVILRRTERSMVRAKCGVQLKDRKRSTDSMLMLSLREIIDQLAIASSVRWYGHVLRRALDFEVDGQWKKRGLNTTWKNQVEEESVKIGLRTEDSLCRSKWSVSEYQTAAVLT